MTDAIDTHFDQAMMDVARWHLDAGVPLAAVDVSPLARELVRTRECVASGGLPLMPVEPEPPVLGDYFDVKDEAGMTWRIYERANGDIPSVDSMNIDGEAYCRMYLTGDDDASSFT